MKTNIVRIYEDNGGGIHAICYLNGEPANIISGFEDGGLSRDEFIAESESGFPGADQYDCRNYSGSPLRYAAEEISENDDLIAEIAPDATILYPEKMGISGKILFEIPDEEA